MLIENKYIENKYKGHKLNDIYYNLLIYIYIYIYIYPIR